MRAARSGYFVIEVYNVDYAVTNSRKPATLGGVWNRQRVNEDEGTRLARGEEELKILSIFKDMLLATS